MPFLVPGGASDVTSVNDQRGQVILDYDDVGAVANIMDSCSGIQVGTTNERPSSTDNNMLYVVTDIVPNRFYRYDVELGKWELIGGTGSGGDGDVPTFVRAIDVHFNNNGTIINSSNVQNAIFDLSNSIELSENNLTELITKKENFLKKDIEDNKEELTEIIDRNKETLRQSINENDGKVKIDGLDARGYLDSKIDDITLQVENGKVVARSLHGLEVNIGELNHLKNATSNIQGQIDSLSSVGNFTEAVESFGEINTIENPSEKDMVIVIKDETKDNKSSIYMHNGTNWKFVGEFTADIRDLTTSPVDLEREVTGVLPDSQIDNKIARKSDLGNYATYPINLNDEVTGTLSEINIDDKIARKTDLKEIMKTTDEVEEGLNNLYYTEERVSESIDVKNNKRARHTHENKEIIDKLGEDLDGKLLFDGKLIEGVGGSGTVDWKEF